MPDDIRCLCLDVDGVLTDGRVYIDDDGRPTRAFQVQDGLAVRWFQRFGGTAVILTGKQSQGLLTRASELEVEHVIQDSRDKLTDLKTKLTELKLTLEQTAFVGDDLPDLAPMLVAGYPIAVANAVYEVRSAARFVTDKPGGAGAVREAVEHLLRIKGRWQEVVDHFRAPAAADLQAQETE